MKFVDVKNDIAFRKIFGNEKKSNILLSFLNAILKLEGEERIKEVTIINPYQLPRVAGEKASIIDVRAKDERGQQFVIEMQVVDVEGFDKRVQYYTCRDYSMQIDRGEDYALLKPTYFIGILDFNFFDSEDYLSHHLIMNGKTYEHSLKDIQFTFIELKKFDKPTEELETLEEKWVFFLKEAENLDVIPENTDDEGLVEAYKDADKYNWAKEELIAYDNSYIAQQDAIGRVTIAIKKEMYEVAKRCLDNGMSIELTAEVTGLSVEQVKEIQQKNS